MANSNVKVKPMLAATAEAEEGQAPKVSFPILVSPKLDGIRALRMNGQLVSRTLKPIPSPRAQEITAHLPDGVDGELIVGRPNHDPYRRTVSAVMTENDNTLDSMVPTGMLGGFHVKDVKTGVEFDVSSSAHAFQFLRAGVRKRISVLREMLIGFCQGAGFFGLSILAWAIWKITHSRIAHKLENEHWFHSVGEFFK